MNNNDFIKVMINDVNTLVKYLDKYKNNKLMNNNYSVKVIEYVDILNYILNNVLGKVE